jgi:hypothetical protein
MTTRYLGNLSISQGTQFFILSFSYLILPLPHTPLRVVLLLPSLMALSQVLLPIAICRKLGVDLIQVSSAYRLPSIPFRLSRRVRFAMHSVCYLVISWIYFFKTSILLFLAANSFQGVAEGFGFSPFVALSSGVSLELLSGCLATDWLVGLP